MLENNINSKIPNFLVVGAMKSGTTSLWYYIKQHPEIFMPETKELRFLAHLGLMNEEIGNSPRYYFLNPLSFNSISEYLDEFNYVKNESAIGEASPEYLYTYETTIPVIKKYIGDPKIIILLRNPTERAYSAYQHIVKNNSIYNIYKVKSFEESLREEENHKVQKLQYLMCLYKNLGLYYTQVKAYFDNFSKVKVIIYDEFVKDTENTLKDVFNFLEVDSSFKSDYTVKQNVSPPMNNIFQKILFSKILREFAAPILFKSFGEKRSMRTYNKFVDKLKKKDIKPETREYLKDYFREDILKLQNLINKDLSHWLK